MPTKSRSRKRADDTKAETSMSAGIFKFQRFCITSIELRDAGKPAEENSSVATKLQFELKASIDEAAGVSALAMGVRFDGSGSRQPYLLRIEILGEFSMAEGKPEQLRKFTQVNAPVILFPYLRAAVDRTTADGRYGPLRLHPTNLQKLIDPKAWERPPLPARSPEA